MKTLISLIILTAIAQAKELPEAFKREIQNADLIYITEDRQTTQGIKRESIEVIKGELTGGRVSIKISDKAVIGHKLLEIRQYTSKNGIKVLTTSRAYTIRDGIIKYSKEEAVRIEEIKLFMETLKK